MHYIIVISKFSIYLFTSSVMDCMRRQLGLAEVCHDEIIIIIE